MITKQQGFSLLELMLVIAIIGAIALYKMQDQMEDLDKMRANQLGKQIYQYNIAALSYLAEHSAIEFDPPLGTGWLKSVECGGTGVRSYLPCDFPNVTTFGNLNYNTRIYIDDAGFTLAETKLDPLIQKGRLRSDLTGLAAIKAEAEPVSNSTHLLGVTDLRFESDPETAILTLKAAHNGTGGFNLAELMGMDDVISEISSSDKNKIDRDQLAQDFMLEVGRVASESKKEGITMQEIKDVLTGKVTVNVNNYDSLSSKQNTGNRFLDILISD